LDNKKTELNGIIAETEKEEQDLIVNSKKAEKHIEERLLTAYHRIRGSSRNGLAVVTVQRDACGGCFNQIPPQRQMDIRTRKKIAICEHCGRVLVDSEINTVEA
jgi:predicted  nucleic acid-binding Zn-ribbon protein